ncbi:hypothetical protein HmCmsJML160_01542 [Escherichia coli]|nr:hypothetical protein HmCmsJML160_01542 [Escherichia coli]
MLEFNRTLVFKLIFFPSRMFSLFPVLTLTCIQQAVPWHIPGYLITPDYSSLPRVLSGTLSAGGTDTRNS